MSNIKSKTRIIVTSLIFILVFTLPVAAKNERQSSELQPYLQSTAAWLVRTVPCPINSAVGGEWAVMGMARSDCAPTTGWYDAYYDHLLATVQAADGVLSTRKYTEYSRVILALTALGKDPADVGGYNLLTMLGDYNKVLVQGINGPIFALLALDSGDYAMPVCTGAQQQASREMYIDYILGRQHADGGWSLAGNTSEPDVTGMALQALARYQDDPGVKEAIDRGVLCLSELQDETGDFASGGTANVESTVQVMMALCELKIDPQGSQFIKNGNTVMDSLLHYYVAGGGFKHAVTDISPDLMSTEQGFYALVAYERFLEDKSSFYTMTDVKYSPDHTNQAEGAGLQGKNPDVKAAAVIHNGCTFDDIQGLDTMTAIEALAARGIVSGVDGNRFEPNRSITRAEFAAIVVRGLGLTPVAVKVFADVPEHSWYAAYVGTAHKNGIVTGVSPSDFAPSASITREQAAVMVERAGKLCGLNTDVTDADIQAELGRFKDDQDCAAWSREALAFCFNQSIVAADSDNIEPRKEITRAEMADMLYRMLEKAELI